MKQPLLLGIDIGTSSCKLGLFAIDGTMTGEAVAYYDTHYFSCGKVQQNAEDWYEGVKIAFQSLLGQKTELAENIIGVGIAGIGWSFVPVDEAGSALAPVSIWLDTSSHDQIEEMKNSVPENEIFTLSGNPLSPNYVTPKLMKFKREFPEIYAKTYKFLPSNSYIAYRLTGKMTQEYSQAYGLHFFDLQNKVFNFDFCTRFGLDPDKFPDLHTSHSIIGVVSELAARDTGLTAGTPVVAGGLDAACAALGIGAIYHGDTQEQGGQAGGMGICMSEYLPKRELISGCHVIPDKWLLQGGTVGGGNALRWLKEIMLKESNLCYGDLDAIAEQVSPGCDGLIFLPYLQGERTPIWDAYAKGTFYGVTYQTTKAHFLRSVMEGVAYSLRHNLEAAESDSFQIKALLSTGGSSQSPLWLQIKADVTGLPIRSTNRNIATPLGAALLAGVGIGAYSNFRSAVNKTVKYDIIHFPNIDNYHIYTESYQKYLELYVRIKGL